MNRASTVARMALLLLGLVASMGCGIGRATLMATQEALVRTTVVEEVSATAEAELETAVPATLTAIAATQRAALLSFHGRFVTASGGGGSWLIGQETNLSDCGWFTLRFLDDGKVSLMTCHGRYVTAPESGTTRTDWLLWQEPVLSRCGQFILHDLGSGRFSFETCAGRFFTAGDPGWDPPWSLGAATEIILDWEKFTLLQQP